IGDSAPVGDSARIIKTNIRGAPRAWLYRIHTFDRRTLPASPLRVWTGERGNSQTPRNSVNDNGTSTCVNLVGPADGVAVSQASQVFQPLGRLFRNSRAARRKGMKAPSGQNGVYKFV